MDLWQLITNDHANITDLGRAILRGLDNGVVRSRDRLFDQLDGALRRHMEAEEGSLYDALEDRERTRRLIDELGDEHEEIERQLTRLASLRNKNSEDWTNQFEDFRYLVDRHFHREEHELLPVAREILSPDDLQDLRHEFAEEKIEALREQHRRWGVSSGVLLGALAGAAAGALAFAAWRAGDLRTLAAPREERPRLSWYAEVKRRSRENRARRERDPLLR
jgi:hemerythrin-like domain-containing protein